MSWELFYTSAPSGLRPGSRGFCTVARTEGMPAPLIDRLESLSSYQPLGSLELAPEQSPILLAHWRVSVAGRARGVLSRVAMAGSDYSGRQNKLAYHLVLEPAEQADAGPMAMLLNPSLMHRLWTGEPRVLKPRRLTLDGIEDRRPAGGVNPRDAQNLADAFVADPTKSSCVIFPLGVDPAPLLAAALRLLEPRLRWQVTFATLFSELAAGLSCNWRCLLAGSLAAGEAARHATSGVLIDLAARAGQNPHG